MDKQWISNDIRVKQWGVFFTITYSCPNFNGDLVKSLLKLEHGWVIISHINWRLTRWAMVTVLSKRYDAVTSLVVKAVYCPNSQYWFSKWSTRSSRFRSCYLSDILEHSSPTWKGLSQGRMQCNHHRFSTAKRKASWWQTCRHLWHRGLLYRQSTLPQVTTKLASRWF